MANLAMAHSWSLMAIGFYLRGLQYTVNNVLPYFSVLHFSVKDQSDRKM